MAFLKEVVKPRRTGGRRPILTTAAKESAKRRQKKLAQRRRRAKHREGEMMDDSTEVGVPGTSFDRLAKL